MSPDKSQTATPSIPACFANAALRFSDSGSSYVTTWFVYGDTKNGVLEQESQKRVNPAIPDECGSAVLVELLAFAGDESALSEEGGELDLGAAGVAVRVFERDDRLWRRCCLGVVLRGCLGVRASAGIQALLQRRPAGGVEVAVRGDTEDDLVEGEFRARPCFDARGSA